MERARLASGIGRDIGVERSLVSVLIGLDVGSKEERRLEGDSSPASLSRPLLVKEKINAAKFNSSSSITSRGYFPALFDFLTILFILTYVCQEHLLRSSKNETLYKVSY